MPNIENNLLAAIKARREQVEASLKQETETWRKEAHPSKAKTLSYVTVKMMLEKELEWLNTLDKTAQPDSAPRFARVNGQFVLVDTGSNESKIREALEESTRLIEVIAKHGQTACGAEQYGNRWYFESQLIMNRAALQTPDPCPKCRGTGEYRVGDSQLSDMERIYKCDHKLTDPEVIEETRRRIAALPKEPIHPNRLGELQQTITVLDAALEPFATAAEPYNEYPPEISIVDDDKLIGVPVADLRRAAAARTELQLVMASGETPHDPSKCPYCNPQWLIAAAQKEAGKCISAGGFTVEENRCEICNKILVGKLQECPEHGFCPSTKPRKTLER
jgi:hypothetical protein